MSPSNDSLHPTETSRLLPPTLSRHDSSNSHRSSHSIHSQRAHHSHYSLDDPTNTLSTGPTMPNGHHVHPQHGDVFIPVHAGNVAPDFEGYVAAEQREEIESDLEEEEMMAEEEERRRRASAGDGLRDDADRRRSVTFDSLARSPISKSRPLSNRPSFSASRSRSRSKDPLLKQNTGHIDAAGLGAGESAISESSTVTDLPGDSHISTGSTSRHRGRGDDDDPMKDAALWATIREGSIARRAKWRRPGMQWLLPVVTCFALCWGMGAAPKQELMINLVCLAHPPQTQTHSAAFGAPADPVDGMSMTHMARLLWNAPRVKMDEVNKYYDAKDQEEAVFSPQGYADEAAGTNALTGKLPELTPADRWLIDVQRRIAADRARQRLAAGHPLPGDEEIIREGDPSSLPSQSPPPAASPSPTSPPHAGDDLPSGEVPHRPVSNPENGTAPVKEKPVAGVGRKGEARPGEIDPRLCKKDPRTQAAAAKLTMTMTLVMGILSALTTAFWGTMSDKWGRTKVMSIAILGLVSNDIILIATATFPDKVPGGYKFLILGPLIDGWLGGFSTISATNHAYLSDTTPDGSRAKMFGRFQGIMMCGFSIGPILGSFIVRASGQIMSVFYFAACANLILVIFVAFILPESLSSEARAALHKAAQLKRQRLSEREAAERAWEDECQDDPDVNASGWSRISGVNGQTRSGKRFRGRMKRLRRRMFAFLSPLRLFMPREKVGMGGDGMGKGVKDYNLLLLVATLGCISTLMSLMQLKSQFLLFRYGWTSAELGPYLTLMAGFRAFMLLIAFPIIVRAFKPQIKADPSWRNQDVKHLQSLADSRFDLNVMRIGLFIETFAYGGMAFLVPAPIYVILTCVVTLGSCNGPAANSLALNLIDSSKDAGRLFGGISVITAMSSTFLGPLLFSLTFANTVATYPPTVFAVAVGVLIVAQVLLSFVRLAKDPERPDVERGRPTRVKRVKSSSMASSSHRGSVEGSVVGSSS